jgi:hypothetical protein
MLLSRVRGRPYGGGLKEECGDVEDGFSFGDDVVHSSVPSSSTFPYNIVSRPILISP